MRVMTSTKRQENISRSLKIMFIFLDILNEYELYKFLIIFIDKLNGIVYNDVETWRKLWKDFLKWLIIIRKIKKRTAIWLDKTEFFNLSQTTEKDLKYYLNDRRERETYLDMLPKVKLAYKYFKTKAYEREDYFREHFAEE